MQRNQKEELLKHIRREYERYCNIDNRAYTLEPLEKPVFAGWDVYVDLNVSKLGNYWINKADRYRAIMRVFQWDKPRFTKDKSIIKWLRKNHYDYKKCMDNVPTFKGRLGHYIPIHFSDPFKVRELSKSEFDKLPDNCKEYFERHVEMKYGITHTKYNLYPKDFPFHALELKVKKSYWKALKHPDGEAVSEYTKLRHKLWSGSYSPYLNKALCDPQYRWWKQYNRAGNRALCHDLLKVARDEYSTQEAFDPEILDMLKENSIELPVYTDALADIERAFNKHRRLYKTLREY